MVIKNESVNDMKRCIFSFLLVGVVIGISSLYVKEIHIFDKEKQTMMSQDQIVQDLIDGNKRFYTNRPLKRRSLVAKLQKASEQGQFPKAVILACMDSRSIPEIVFDQS